MNGKDIIKLAADLAAGGITADAIKEQYGEGVLSSVLAIGGGLAAGVATNLLLDQLDKHIGIVSDLGGAIDDIGDAVGGLFKW